MVNYRVPVPGFIGGTEQITDDFYQEIIKDGP